MRIHSSRVQPLMDTNRSPARRRTPGGIPKRMRFIGDHSNDHSADHSPVQTRASSPLARAPIAAANRGKVEDRMQKAYAKGEEITLVHVEATSTVQLKHFDRHIKELCDLYPGMKAPFVQGGGEDQKASKVGPPHCSVHPL